MPFEQAAPAPRERRLGVGLPLHYGSGGVERRLRAFARHIALEGDRLLDVGCGSGAYTTVMAAGFREVVGIDIMSDRIEAFAQHIAGTPGEEKVTLHVMSAENIEYPDDHFDVVTAIEVLEHVLDLDKTVAEIERVLKPGGVLAITVPNRLFPTETHSIRVAGRGVKSKYIPFLPYVKPLHRRISSARNFRPRELMELTSRAGLTHVATDYVMPPFDGLGRRLPRLRDLSERLERGPLAPFGVSVVGIYRKPTTSR